MRDYIQLKDTEGSELIINVNDLIFVSNKNIVIVKHLYTGASQEAYGHGEGMFSNRQLELTEESANRLRAMLKECIWDYQEEVL